MNVRDIYSAAYMNVERWPEDPESHKITEVGIDADNFSKDRNARIIWIKLDGSETRYRVNRTNADNLAKAYGTDPSRWKGKSITIHRQQQTIRGQQGWAGIMLPLKGAKTK